MKFIFCIQLLLCSILSSSKADFTFTLRVNGISTSGNCFGDDLSLPCETFLSTFCLRGPRQSSSTSSSDCPLGVNNQQIGHEVKSGTRTIRSTAPWQGGFQMLIRAFDDDAGVSSPDHLDNIIINRGLAANSGPTSTETYSGSRVSIDMSFRVDCNQNYYGADCSVHCIAQDDDVNGHFTCDPDDGSRICLRDYYGSDCLTFCQASNDENNGFYTCDPEDGSRICSNGFEDPETFCITNINDCTEELCQNGGNCTDLVAGFLCECAPGYTGETCSTDINECLEADCPTNSTCVQDALNSFACECLPGFEGENCTEIQPCDSVVCENGGTCTSEDPFSFKCLCAAGYNGSTCQLDINECLGAVCSQGSKCTDQINGYMCIFPQNDDSSERQSITTDKKAVIIGCAIGAAVIVLLILIIVITSVLLGHKKVKRYYIERSSSHIYHPGPASAKVMDVPLKKDAPNRGPLEDTMDFNSLYNEPNILSPVSDVSFSLNDGVIYEQVPSSSHHAGPKLLPANPDINGDVTLCPNVAYGTLKNQLVTNPVYGTGVHSQDPPIYSVPRPTCSPPKTGNSNQYETPGKDKATGTKGSPVPNRQSPQSHPAYYESIELLQKDPPLKDKEAAVASSGKSSSHAAANVSCEEDTTPNSSEVMRYSKLRHSDQVGKMRLATIPDSGYEALQS